jgi:NAD(P)-dependent dehydrogenase (short-subunit alcohol dehydrogenase family)
VNEWHLGAGLDASVVIVTGASGGIGACVVRAVRAAGALVLAVDLDAAAVVRATSRDGQPDPGVVAVGVDLRDTSAYADLVDRAGELGPLRGLVHCAAVLVRRAELRDVTEADWDLQHDVNLKASFFLCRAVGDALRAAGRGGRIVTFGSQGWWTGGFGGSVVYAASKGGIVSMTRGLAREYGPDAVTVNCVAPGQARTEMLLTDLDAEVLERMTSQTPLGRIAEPEEIAAATLFLLSDHASFMTGSTLNVSGGFLMY